MVMQELYRNADNTPSTSFVFDNEALAAALERIYRQKFNPQTEIDKGLFTAILNTLNDGIDRGFTSVAGDRWADFLDELKTNNAVFAAFKTHRAQNDIAGQLLDENGQLKSFAKFKEDIAGITSHHVERWLRTEYDAAVSRAHHAADWKQFEREKDILPNLRWNESTSIEPRDIHRVFWNRIWPMDHPHWTVHYPGMLWGCKCSLSNTDAPPTDNFDLDGIPSTAAPGLGGNPALTGKIFSDDHPYIANAYKGAKKAVDNLLKQIETAFRTYKTYKSGGEISIHVGVDKKKSDYKTVLTVARRFAEAGHHVQLTPVVHFKSAEYKEIYGSLLNTKFARKCPDLKIDGQFYEFESYVPPFNKNKVKHMLSHGLKQSSRIIIDNNKGAADWYIRRLIHRRVNEGAMIDEVWLYEKGQIRLLDKKKSGK